MKEQRYSSEARAVMAWWQALTPREEQGRAIRGDRAALARLRRADSLLEAASEPATIELYDKLRSEHSFGRDKEWMAKRDLPRAALIAAILAHVRKDDRDQMIASAIGVRRSGEDTPALITPLRFKRLITARSADELLVAFRRLVAILDRTVNVADLARLLLAFTDPDPEKADIARTIFAFHYHGAGNYAPDLETNNS